MFFNYCWLTQLDLKVHILLVVPNVDFSTRGYSTSVALVALIQRWIQHTWLPCSKIVHKMEAGPLWTTLTLHPQIVLITTTSKTSSTIRGFSKQTKSCFLPLMALPHLPPLLTTLPATKQPSSKPLFSPWLIWVILAH